MDGIANLMLIHGDEDKVRDIVEGCFGSAEIHVDAEGGGWSDDQRILIYPDNGEPYALDGKEFPEDA